MPRHFIKFIYMWAFILLAPVIISAQQKETSPPPPPPPPPPPEKKVEEVFIEVAKMPRFPGCEDLATGREECSNRKMMEFFYKNLQYPEEARRKGITGTVRASFIIEPSGFTDSEKIVSGLSKACDEEVLRVLRLMRSQGIRWTPQSARGRPVRILREVVLEFSGKVETHRG